MTNGPNRARLPEERHTPETHATGEVKELRERVPGVFHRVDDQRAEHRVLLSVDEPGVDRKSGAGDVASVVRDEPGDGIRHVGSFDHRHGQGIGQRHRERWVAVENSFTASFTPMGVLTAVG